MSKFTTNSKREAKQNPDLIYLDKRVMDSIRSLKTEQIIRCDNPICGRVLPQYHQRDDNNKSYTTYLKHGDKNYCDKWCRSEDGYVHGNNNTEHKCRKCGEILLPINKNTGRKHYRILCAKCLNKRSKVKETKKCKICNLDQFIKDYRLIKGYRMNVCKICENAERRLAFDRVVKVKIKEKCCSVCGITKNINEFNKSGVSYYSFCKQCKIDKQREYRKTTRDKQKIYRENRKKKIICQ